MDGMEQKFLKDLEFVAFDTETTGISAHTQTIVEIAAVRFNVERGTLAYFQTLVNPARPIPLNVIAIHGINDEMVKDSPSLDQVLPHFFRFIDGAIPVAHNSRFDIDFIGVPSVRYGLELPKIPVLDSCRLARRVMRGLTSYRLENLTRELGIAANTYHRALADSVSCAELFRLLVQKGVGPLGTWEQLLHTHGKPAYFQESVEPVREVNPQLAPILAAIRTKKQIEIEYEGSYGARAITPLLLYAKGKSQYLEATCHLDDMRKTFRLDRIVRIL